MLRNAIFPLLIASLITSNIFLLAAQSSTPIPLLRSGPHTEPSQEPAHSAQDVIRPISAEERIADYTEALAWFTAILAVVALAQGYFLVRADRIASQQFLASHRPRLTVRHVESLDMIPYEKAGEIRWGAIIAVANVGDSEAIVLSVGCDIAERGVRNKKWEIPPRFDLDRAKLIDVPEANGDFGPAGPRWILKAGQQRRLEIVAANEANVTNTIEVQNGNLERCALGEVRYLDLNGIDRVIGFLWLYNPVTKLFERTEDAQYAYDDR